MNGKQLSLRVLLLGLLAVPWAVADTGVTNPPGVGLYDEGTRQGQVQRLDCVGSSIACTKSGVTGTLTLSGSGAPTDAQYWVGAADGTLTAEKDLSGFTALVLNTAGTPSAYGGAAACAANNFVTTISAVGATTCAAATASVSLDAITAAVADQAGISNADWNIRWNWAKTTNSEQAFRFSESAAATGGTTSSGIPNQVLLYVDTLAASTMSPLCVYSRATHTFCVSATTAQIFAASGTAAAPTYSSAVDNGAGMYFTASNTFINAGGTATAILRVSSNLGFGNPGIRINASTSPTTVAVSNTANGNTGFYWPASDTFAITNATDGEWVRFLSFATQHNQAGANTTAHAINCRKARGTVAAPTVITTGDDTCGWYGIAYVGVTNTYQTASYILQDTGGTISDSATGIAGLIKFATANTGAEPVVQWTMDNTGNLISTGVVQASLGTPADGSIIYCSDCTKATPCAGGGTGAFAVRLNGAWDCNV